MFGVSAGGGLLAASILKMQQLNLPLPAVLSLGTPWSDLTKTGDSYYTNEDIDNVIITYDGMVEACAKLYAGGAPLTDPFISPIYGNYTKDFPPSLLITGTRDLFLSNTVRLFRKLRQADVQAELQVFEGMSHAFFANWVDAPESKEVFKEMILFFQKHFAQH
jgi:acetyl esterase/lipase